MFLRLLWLQEENQREQGRQSRVTRRNLRRNLSLQNPLEGATLRQDFVKVYRLTPTLFEELCRELVPLLNPQKKADAISPTTKIMTTLAFYASGSYQRTVGMSIDSCMAQQTVSDAVREVTAALNNPQILAKYIRFPQNVQEREKIKQDYYRTFGMPGVMGCIDCTHVAMRRPPQNEERYFNRKYYHSRNVQMICDSKLYILSVDASFGGASHDSYIFQNSQVKRYMEVVHEQGESTWLLGDSGYPQRAYMMTPIANAIDGTPEGLYNKKQKTTRTTIERTFGVLKGRWRCLLAARALHYDPLTVARIVNACCVLHNLCNARRAPAPQLSERDQRLERYLQQRPNVLVVPRRTAAADLQAGREARARLVQTLTNVAQH